MASIGHECLREWLTDPTGQLVNSTVTFRRVADGIVLDIPVLFVSHLLDHRETNVLKAHASTSEMNIESGTQAQSIPRSDPTCAPDPGGGDEEGAAKAEVEPRNPHEVGRSIAVQIVTMSGRAASVEFRVVQAAVEIWHRGELCAALDRGQLRSWLATPDGPLLEGTVELRHDRRVDRGGRVALSLPDVSEWSLSPTEFAELRANP